VAADPKTEALSQVDLFSRCTKKELKSIAALCTAVNVGEGVVLTTEGGPGRECFVVAEGHATVTVGGRPLAEVGPSDLVGEMSLLDGGRRSATVTARSPMALYAMTPGEFRIVLRDNPDVSAKIMAVLARRLREAEPGRPA
jgi:CRP/FNR family transcriptional regulator, cyclic AMP receptor protein